MVVVHLGWVDSDVAGGPPTTAIYCPTWGWNIANLSQPNPGTWPPWSPCTLPIMCSKTYGIICWVHFVQFFLYQFKAVIRSYSQVENDTIRLFLHLQGCTKRWAPGCVKMRWKSWVLLPAEGKQNATFPPIFTQPGKSLLVQSCTWSQSRMREHVKSETC